MKPKALSKYFFVFYLIQVKEKINTINIVRAISVIHHFLRPKLHFQHYCVHTEQRKYNSKNYEKLGRMSTSKRKSLDQFYAKNKCITLANDFCRKNNKSIRTSSSAKTMKRPKIRRWPKNCPRPDSNGYIQKYYRGPPAKQDFMLLDRLPDISNIAQLLFHSAWVPVLLSGMVLWRIITHHFVTLTFVTKQYSVINSLFSLVLFQFVTIQGTTYKGSSSFEDPL